MKLESSLLGRWEKCKSDFDMVATHKTVHNKLK